MTGSDIVREFYENYFGQKATEEFLQNTGAMQERFDTAVKQLDKDDRQIITMRQNEKLTNRQVAKQLGVSEPIASMQYLRAVRRLMKVISGE